MVILQECQQSLTLIFNEFIQIPISLNTFLTLLVIIQRLDFLQHFKDY